MNFTLDQLLTLESIVNRFLCEGGSRTHRVPSAVSYLVRGLESSMGVEIFDRSEAKSRTTPGGRQVLEAARDVLAKAQILERVAAELKDGWEPDLHVVVDGALPMGQISRCLRQFANPDVPTCLRIDVEYQEGVIDVFEDSSADIALVLGFAGDGDDDGYDCRPLGELELVLVASPEHPLAGVPAQADARSAHAELVVRDSSPRFEKQAKPSFMGSRNVAYLSDFHSKRIALLDAAGYGWIPEALCPRGSQRRTPCLTRQRTQLLELFPAGHYTGRCIFRPGRSALLETLLGEAVRS